MCTFNHTCIVFLEYLIVLLRIWLRWIWWKWWSWYSGSILCHCWWSHHVYSYGENIIYCRLIWLLVLQGPSDACAAKTVLRELNDAAKVAIVDKHNELRAKVARGEETNGPQPKASNMRKLVNFLTGAWAIYQMC